MEDTVRLASMISTASSQQTDFIRLFLHRFLLNAEIIILKHNPGGAILQEAKKIQCNLYKMPLGKLSSLSETLPKA